MRKCASEMHSFDKGCTEKLNEFPTLSVGPPKKPMEVHVPRTLEYKTLGELLNKYIDCFFRYKANLLNLRMTWKKLKKRLMKQNSKFCQFFAFKALIVCFYLEVSLVIQ